MLTVRSTINVAGQAVPNIIPAVQGDTGRSIEFTLADFTIPAGSTATYYVQKPSGEAVYNAATINDNKVTVELTAQSLAETGDNYGQVRILNGEDVVTSFDFILLVKPFRGIEAIESTTEMNIFDEAVQNAMANIDGMLPNIIAPVFDTSTTYTAGDYVIYSGKLYQFTIDHAAGAWTGADAEETTVSEDISQLKEDIGDLSELETTDKSDLVSAINEAAQSGGSSTGITNAVKQALLACFENVAWATEDGQDYYDALLASMEVPATAIFVRPSTASFSSASETQQLTTSVTPRDSSDIVTWASSNSAVATVSNAGLVTPIANGSCTITATAGNVSATCSVTVSGIVRSFDVINSLTHCTNSNPSTRVAEGDSYTATLSADSGYWLTNAVVTMGGEDITSTAYDNGTISIAEVTGEITIYAVALEMTIVSTNWTRGNLGNTGSFVNQKWYGAEVTDMITMGANQTLVIYSTDPNWTTNYTGSDGGGKTGNKSICCFYQNASSPSYINPVITINDELAVLTFSSDTSKVSNYSKTIGARVQVSNLVDNLSSIVVGLIDGVV